VFQSGKIFVSNLRLGIIAAVKTSCALLPLADDVYNRSYPGRCMLLQYGEDLAGDDSGPGCCRCLCRVGDFRNRDREEVEMRKTPRHIPEPHRCATLVRSAAAALHEP